MVTAYDPRWPALFEALRDRADAALTGVAHVTEHVGSTAVPGLDAKPIIDLDVVVPDKAAARAAVKALADAGWQHEGDLGITGREAFQPHGDAVYHHLYVVVAGSRPHRDHIDLRDFLRTHPAHAARPSQASPTALGWRPSVEPSLAGASRCTWTAFLPCPRGHPAAGSLDAGVGGTTVRSK